MFPNTTAGADGNKVVVNVRVGTSFISEDQARRNIDLEIPDQPESVGRFFSPNDGVYGLRVLMMMIIVIDESADPVPGSLEATAQIVRGAWAEKLDRINITGASDADLEVFYTAAAHALTYPSEQSEENMYYSAYDNQVHEGPSYTGYSIWVCDSNYFSTEVARSAYNESFRTHIEQRGLGPSCLLRRGYLGWLLAC
jgi:hypothetical protein